MKYDEYMDKECIPVCDALKELPDVRTFESCCGHLKRRFVVYLYTDNPYSMAVITRALDGRYLPTKSRWEVTIETIDVERIPQFCIGIYSEEPFKDYDTMMQDVNEVVESINYWKQPEFYEHFKFNKYNKDIGEKEEPEFKPFDKVLVRDFDDSKWIPALYGFKAEIPSSIHIVTGGGKWKQCIPYEGNEHLLGTDEKMKIVSDMENISYTVDEYVIKYNHIDFSGENTDKFDSFEEAVDQLKRLKLKGCFNFNLYHMTKEVFNISKILEE